jgi:N-acetylmuramoyl-L-alanine amidase
VLAVTAVSLLTSACGASTGAVRPQPTAAITTSPGADPSRPAASARSGASASAAASASPGTPASRQAGSAPGGSGSQPKPLAGKVIGIDPGHNGGNHLDPAFLGQQIWNGRESEDCDTTGTETDGGYTEAQYNWKVAGYLSADLRRDGATVVLTRHGNSGVGPCVNRRAEIINDARANVAIDIHADGGPPSGRGFAVLEPVADGPNDRVIRASERFGDDVRSAFLAGTPMPVSTYDGVDGIDFRDDLAGLNLTTVPKVLIECGNMRNATDARLLTSRRFQEAAARALTAAIVRFLRQR